MMHVCTCFQMGKMPGSARCLLLVVQERRWACRENIYYKRGCLLQQAASFITPCCGVWVLFGTQCSIAVIIFRRKENQKHDAGKCHLISATAAGWRSIDGVTFALLTFLLCRKRTCNRPMNNAMIPSASTVFFTPICSEIKPINNPPSGCIPKKAIA